MRLGGSTASAGSSTLVDLRRLPDPALREDTARASRTCRSSPCRLSQRDCPRRTGQRERSPAMCQLRRPRQTNGSYDDPD